MKEVSSRTKDKLRKRLKKIKKIIFLNSLGLYLGSFLAVKLIIIAYKLVISVIFRIDPALHGFRIYGLNPPESQVWTKTSVLSYFSGEIFIPLLLISAVFLVMLLAVKMRTRRKAALLWLGFSAFQSLFGGILAGIAAKTNQYFVFSWLGMSNFSMVVIAIAMVPALLTAGTFYDSLFLIIKPHSGFGDSTSENRKVLIQGVLYPVLAAIMIMSFALIPAFGKYELLELISGILLVTPLLFYIKIANPPRNSIGYSSEFYKIPLILGLLASFVFLAGNLFFML